jgi:hypothetical protein
MRYRVPTTQRVCKNGASVSFSKRAPSSLPLQTIDGYGQNVQACRLPYTGYNGTILDIQICASSISARPIFAFAGTASETAVGHLITFRTNAGWLVSTVRLACPYLSYFSYNGKSPAATTGGLRASVCMYA